MKVKVVNPEFKLESKLCVAFDVGKSHIVGAVESTARGRTAPSLRVSETSAAAGILGSIGYITAAIKDAVTCERYVLPSNPMQAPAAGNRSDDLSPPVVQFRQQGWHGRLVASTPLHAWLQDGGHPESLDTSSGLVIKDGTKNLCLRLERLGDGGPELSKPYFCKRSFQPGLEGWGKRLIGWRSAARTWRVSWQMLRAQVPVPQPLGYLKPGFRHPGRGDYFWSEWLDRARTARQVAEDHSQRELIVGNPDFAGRVASILAGMHNHGLYHRDTSWKNILIDPATGQVWLVDLDAVRKGSLRPLRAAVRDLARFLIEAEDRGTDADWRRNFVDVYRQRRDRALPGLSAAIAETALKLRRRRRPAVKDRSHN